MSLAVSIKSLDFSYPKQPNALFKNLDFEIGSGQRFGLFGPNGAGKTTLMNLMTGILKPSRGSVSLLGKSFSNSRKEILQQVGFVPQELSYYEVLTPNENLDYFGACYGLSSKEIEANSNNITTTAFALD